MGEEGKKISFGFSKLTKKTSIIGTKKVNEEEKVQFIDCVEEKSIKIKNEEKKEEHVLVIPLNSIKVTEENSGVTKKNIGPRKIDSITRKESILEGSNQTEPSVVESLDSLAAKEILEELNNKTSTEESKKIFAVPLTTNAPLGEKESSLEDYENVPVSEYGLAMLRGMGWSPGKGVGKNEKLITSSAPVLRPKGMGLGADKVIKTLPNLPANNETEELKLVKGAFVRIIAGSHKDSYGRVEGFDEESGRLFVKLSLKNSVVSFNEFMVQLVNKHDFTKNSKVINVKKFEEYKNKEIESTTNENLNKSPSAKNNNHSSNSHLQEISGSVGLTENDNLEKHFPKKSSKYSTKSNRDRSSSHDSASRQKNYSQSRKYGSSSVNKNSSKDQSSSDKSPSPQRTNRSSNKAYSSPGSKKYHKNRSSSDESPSPQRTNSSRSKKYHKGRSSSDESPSPQRTISSSNKAYSSSRSKKYHKGRSSSDESPSPPKRRSHSQSKHYFGSSRDKNLYRDNSPLKQRRKRSQSRETTSNSKIKNYNSNRERKDKSRSRSPRRKHR